MECLIGKLPWILEWLNWHLYAYWLSLVFCIVIGILYYFYWLDLWHISYAWSFSGIGLSIFVGCCAWVVYCAIKYGFAVG